MNETWQYTITGSWNRQGELLAEAERLHRANQALRAARSGRRANRTRLLRSEAPCDERPLGASATPGGKRRRELDRSTGARPVWRAAAGKVGASLVSVGKRLEHVGRPDCE